MTKILFLVSSVNSSGGIQKNLSIISDYLIKNDFDVQILSVFNNNKTFYEFNRKIHMSSCNIKQSNDLKKRLFSVYLKVNHYLSQSNYDLLIVEGMGYYALIRNSILKNSKVIAVDHEGIQFHSSMGLSNLGIKKAVKSANAIRVLTDISKNEYIWKYPFSEDRLYSIANPVNDSIYYSPYNKESKKILFVGRLSKEKGVEYLIDAFIHFKKNNIEFSEWILDIYGEGELYDSLQQRINEHNMQKCIFLKGFKADIHTIYSEYAFLVITSKYESFGLVIIEAMKSGIPVISYDSYYGPKEIIDNEVNGLLVNERSVESLAEAIKKMVISKDLRINLSSHTNENMTRYELEYIGKQWLKMIDDITL